MDYIARAAEVFATEIEALTHVRSQLGEPFVALVEAGLETIRNGGKLVLCGLGKSGHVARKLAATLASTGSPSAYLHPVEAMHGDLGFVAKRDLLIVFSYSGETEELLTIVPAAKRCDVRVVAVTGCLESNLAKFADLVVPVTVPREACPFNLAPTSSTTAMLALGDAFALVLLDAQGFTQEDYGRLHPAGAIGRALTMRAGDIMRPPERTAIITQGSSVREALERMTACRAGSALVVDEAGQLLGIFTDGDFRRHAQDDLTVLARPIESVMSAKPTTVTADAMAVEVIKLVEKRHIDDVPVVDAAGHALGIVDIQDLPGFKLM
jgi:arabinose-5-phosphate isomerase